MPQISRRLLYTLLLTGLLCWQPARAADTKPTFHSFLTAQAHGDRPGSTAQEHFECSDTIYAVIEVTAPDRQKPSTHLLVVNWFNPANELEQRTRFEFNSYGRGTRVWAWLRLSGSSGAAIGQMFDPAYGMEKFIGDWRADVLIDKKKLATHHFDVLC